MANTIQVKYRHAVPFFGTAYPGLSLDPYQQCRLLTAIVVQKFCKHNGLADTVGTECSANHEHFDIKIGGHRAGTDPKSYCIACDIEKYFNNTPRLGLLSPPRFWHRIFGNRLPVDTYLLEINDASHTMDWLFDNLHHTDYQLFSKFGGDISVGLKSPEHSTMFKLHQDIDN